MAETLGRLVGQHLTLLRIEVEAEAREAASEAKRQGIAAAVAAPFIVAGVLLVSLGVAFALGQAFEGLLGAAALPVMLVAVGLLEAAVAIGWLRRALGGTPAGRARAGLPNVSASAGGEQTHRGDHGDRPRLEDKTYGAVGRA